MTWPVPMNLVSGKTQRETSQLEARAGLRDTIGLGHAEFRKHVGKWKGKKKCLIRDPDAKLFEVCTFEKMLLRYMVVIKLFSLHLNFL